MELKKQQLGLSCCCFSYLCCAEDVPRTSSASLRPFLFVRFSVQRSLSMLGDICIIDLYHFDWGFAPNPSRDAVPATCKGQEKGRCPPLTRCANELSASACRFRVLH